MRRAPPVLALLLGTLLDLGAPDPARATPPDLFGFGPRSQALGMTGVSYADDYEAVYANPAGLARARRVGIHLGVSGGAYHLTIDGARDPLDPARAVTIGATVPLPLPDVLEDRLVLGIGASIPQQLPGHAHAYSADVPQWSVLDRAQSMAIVAGLGFDFHSTDLEGLRIGLGLAASVDVVGALDVRWGETSPFSSPIETQASASFAPIAGVSYDTGQWTGGIVYRHEVRSGLVVDVARDDVPASTVTVGELVQYDPAQLAGEISFRPDPSLRIVAHLTVRFWSLWPGAQLPTSSSSLLPPAPQFSDTVSPRLGIEGTVRGEPVQLTLRGGYALELSPAPAARLAPQRTASGEVYTSGGVTQNMPVRDLDNDRHIVTAGLGFLYDLSATERVRLDLFAQAHLLVDRTHTIPAPGVSSTAMADWMRTGGFVLAGGWNLALEF